MLLDLGYAPPQTTTRHRKVGSAIKVEHAAVLRGGGCPLVIPTTVAFPVGCISEATETQRSHTWKLDGKL